jgi:hypothetical protein
MTPSTTGTQHNGRSDYLSITSAQVRRSNQSRKSETTTFPGSRTVEFSGAQSRLLQHSARNHALKCLRSRRAVRVRCNEMVGCPPLRRPQLGCPERDGSCAPQAIRIQYQRSGVTSRTISDTDAGGLPVCRSAARRRDRNKARYEMTL